MLDLWPLWLYLGGLVVCAAYYWRKLTNDIALDRFNYKHKVCPYGDAKDRYSCESAYRCPKHSSIHPEPSVERVLMDSPDWIFVPLLWPVVGPALAIYFTVRFVFTGAVARAERRLEAVQEAEKRAVREATEAAERKARAEAEAAAGAKALIERMEQMLREAQSDLERQYLTDALIQLRYDEADRG